VWADCRRRAAALQCLPPWVDHGAAAILQRPLVRAMNARGRPLGSCDRMENRTLAIIVTIAFSMVGVIGDYFL
jgi:hypothetical protein